MWLGWDKHKNKHNKVGARDLLGFQLSCCADVWFFNLVWFRLAWIDFVWSNLIRFGLDWLRFI